MAVDGETTAEAEWLFVKIDEQLARKYFGEATGEAAPSGVANADLP
jgi:hypothetical protein